MKNCTPSLVPHDTFGSVETAPPMGNPRAEVLELPLRRQRTSGWFSIQRRQSCGSVRNGKPAAEVTCKAELL